MDSHRTMTHWWRQETFQVAEAQQSDCHRGLSQAAAASRLARFGPNQLAEKKLRSPLAIFFEQFHDFMIWVLCAASLVSGFLGEWVDAIAILVIVVLNAVLGFIQEYRAERSLAALKSLSSPNSKVIRGGEREVVPSSQLVPGDLIELEAGDHIPADARLVYTTGNFAVQEASLTGESVPVAKTTRALAQEDLPLAERANMAYCGTSVTSGKAAGIVVATAMQTELGLIAGMIQEITKESTPLQERLERFGKWIVYVCFALVALIFLLGMMRGGSVIEMFLTSVSLAVAAIPEGLPAVVTISLALGVQRMVKRHALIRKLPSVETLGCATVICSDKTGTLTKNEMTVRYVFTPWNLFEVSGTGYRPEGALFLNGKETAAGSPTLLKKTLLYGVLCNASQLVEKDGAYTIIGDPTEGALLTVAAKAGIRKEEQEKEFVFVEEIPFDSQRKKMTVVRTLKDARIACVKGAPDILLGDCVSLEEGQSVRRLTDADRKRIMDVNAGLADKAMRVLAVAYKKLDASSQAYEAASLERDLVFLGLFAMIDPPRAEVKSAIRSCRDAGIRPVMITGDHKNTAVAIAKELELFQEDSLALSGDELDALSDEELRGRVEKIAVYARVSAEHKLRVVRAWRAKGDVVAMTGDGVNDAPAVKEADIGVAMGITGTDVTKEVSDMVVTDDNFASIVAAVEEGRGIYENIKKFIHYLLSCNAGEVLVMFVASLVGLPAPLLPIHILWVNLVTDGLPALALGVDPVDPGIMRNLPRSRHEAVVTRARAWAIILQGAFIAGCSLSAFLFVLFVDKGDIGRARTAAFVVLACAQLFHAYNCRSQTRSLFSLGLFSNSKLVYATAISFFLLVAVVYLPFCQKVFKTQMLTVPEWGVVLALSSFPLWAMEIVKAMRGGRTAAPQQGR